MLEINRFKGVGDRLEGGEDSLPLDETLLKYHMDGYTCCCYELHPDLIPGKHVQNV